MSETAARLPAPAEAAGPERLIYFSDAVIAIAITLLALELPTPGAGVHGNAGLLAFLGEHATEYVAFLISFAAVAMHWLIHQRLFRYAAGLDGRLIRWNLLWLLMIVLMPFTTKLLTSDTDAFQVQFTVYAVDQALAGLFLVLALSDLRRHTLLKPNTPTEVLENGTEFMTAVVVMFALSIPVAFVTNWAALCWLLLPLLRKGVQLIRRRG
ncbi:MAG TPA: TMEM175 family protein [Kutzneria sp.]|nr:TMEM175 family protein [Kutzneria sp.]